MILAVKDHVNIYSSPALKVWKQESEFGKEIGAHGGVWECPDLFPLMDDEGVSKWVMLVSINPGGPQGGSATQYFVGDFDGSVFTPDDEQTRWIDYGADNYAGVTWSDIPESDGRRLFMGWMSNWQYATIVPTTAWRSAMTLPRELGLRKTNSGWMIEQKIAREFSNISSDNARLIENMRVNKLELHKELGPLDSLMDISLEIMNSEDFNIALSNVHEEYVQISFGQDQVRFDRTQSGKIDFHNEFGAVHSAPLLRNGDKLKVRLLIDLSSIELIVNDGDLVMTEIVFPSSPYEFVEIQSAQELDWVKCEYSGMKSIWN